MMLFPNWLNLRYKGNTLFYIKLFGFFKSLSIMFAVTAILMSTSVLANAEAPLEKVSLQLNWKYQFQFAGFIAAKEKGFYKDAGLDVELIEYQAGVNVRTNILTQKNNYGLEETSIYIDNKKIIPIKLLATYFPKSPHVLAVSKDIQSPNDLIRKKVMISKSFSTYNALSLMLNHFYLSGDNIKFIDHRYDINDFIDNKVDAVAVYRTNELFELEQKGIDFNILDPADYGDSMSANNLFTSMGEAKDHPERTQRFVKASNKGWAYALAHQEEIISIIYSRYSKIKSIEALRFEATQINRLMQSDAIAIGTINHAERVHLIKQFKRSGLLLDSQELNDDGEGALFTPEQVRYLQNKKEIAMCTDPNWMPYERIENGQHIGIVADIYTYFRSKLPIPIRLIKTDGWQESVDKARNRDCDILSLVAETPKRKEYMDFTHSFIDHPVVLATKNDAFFINDISDVKDKQFGVVKGYALAELLQERYPEANIVEVDSISDGLERVENGELFGYIDSLMAIAFLIQQDFTGTLKVSSRLQDKAKLAVATRNDQPQLNEIFEVLVSSLTDAQLQSFFNERVEVKREVIFDQGLVWRLFAILLSVFLALFIWYFFKLKRLNSELAEQKYQVEQEKERFKTIFDKSGNGLLLIDNNQFIDCNEKAVELLGYDSKDELLMKKPAEDLSPKYQSDGQLSTQNCINNAEICLREGSYHFEWLHHKKDGSKILMDVLLTRLDYDGKQIIHVTWRDLTAQKKYEQAILDATEQANKATVAKSEFLANMSHELRTPLHGILSFASMGVKKIDSASSEKLLHYFSRIKLSGDRLLLLLNDLLDLSKLESGKMELNIKRADLAKLFERHCQEQEQRIHDKGLTIQVDASNGAGTGMFDGDKVGQVMANLLSNAIKFSAENTDITVKIDRDEQYLVFSLTNQGVGIPEAELDDIFDAFIQSSKTKTGAGGTGLGLAICKQIIEKHNGQIWAENSPEDEGATFKFILPLIG